MDHERTASALAADLAMREKEVRRLRSRMQTLLKEKKDERKAIRVAKAEALAAVRDATQALARETERKTHWKQKHSSQRRVSEELARRGARWRRELQDLQEQLADMEASFDALQRRNAQLKAAAESSAKAKLTAEREVAKLKQLHTAAVRRALHAEAQLEAAGIAVSPQHDAEASPGRSPASVAGTESSPQGTPSTRVAQLRRGGSSRRSRVSASPAGGPASPVPSLPSPAAIPSPRPGAGSPVFPIARHNRFLESFVVAGLGESDQTEPGVLWKYPPDVEVTPMVASMCFPSGCSIRKMDGTRCVVNVCTPLCSGSRFPTAASVFVCVRLPGVVVRSRHGLPWRRQPLLPDERRGCRRGGHAAVWYRDQILGACTARTLLHISLHCVA